MGWASQSGRARTNPSNPQAFGVCDRCGIWYNHYKLRWQFDWRGASMMNIRILVCPTCYDTPQQQLRAIVLPADPVPILNPRVEAFIADETSTRATSGQDATDFWTGIPVPGGNTRITQSDGQRAVQQTGGAQGSLNEEPGTDPNAPGDDDPGLPLDNDEVPKTGPLE